jgi:CHAT domain-containing protein
MVPMGSWSAAAVSTRAALLALAIVLGGAAPVAGEPPQSALQEARELDTSGESRAALDLLERFLTQSSGSLTDADSAVIHVKAASYAGSAGEPEKARDHLHEVVRLLPVYAPAPQLRARLEQEAAQVYVRIGDFGSAEPLLTSSARELIGVDRLEAADAANALGVVELELLHPEKACAAFDNSLALLKRAKAAQSRRVPVLYNLVTCQLQSGKTTGARKTLQTLKAASADDPDLRLQSGLAEAQFLLTEAKLKEAGTILRGIAGSSKDNDPVRGDALFLLASARFDRGLTREATGAGLAAASAYGTTRGDWHPVLARTFHLLGNAYEELWDFDSAEDYFAKAAEIERHDFGPRSVQFEGTEIERGWLELRTGHVESADRRARRAVEFLQHSPVPDRRREGLAHILVGLVAEARDDREDAVANYLAGQRLIEIANGPQSPDLTFSFVRLGRLLTVMGRYQEARAKLDRAIAIYQQLRSRWSVRLADALTARADLYAALGDQDAELNDSRRAYALLKERALVPEGTAEGFAEAQRYSARELLALHAVRLSELARANSELYGEAFAATQEALISRAGDALRRTMQRFSMESTELARLIGDREDARDAIRQTDAVLSRSLSAVGAKDSKEQLRLQQLRRQKLEDLNRLTKLLLDKFPEMAQFEHPAPVELQALQDRLSEDETALVTVITEHRFLLWAVRHDGFEVAVTPTSAGDLTRLASDIRQSVGRALDREAEAPLPEFDRDAARRLYAAVISPIASSLRGKRHIIFVPDGPLQKIPLHIALGGPDDKWLLRQYAITTMPSLGALLAGRVLRQPSRAAKSFLGIGATDFSAYSRVPNESGGGSDRAVGNLLAHLQPLPEAASELRQIASLFPAPEVTLDLGDQATKEEFRSAPPGAYRNIVFASHAIMAGEGGLDEPAIVLFPADKPVSEGLLTASEVAQLRLDADLVILSACNTAAPDGGPYAEGLSGLVRSFMLAGARSMLVSHWAAPTKSTPKITTGFMKAIQADSTIRKAEALRVAILSLLKSGDAELEHPAYWAPFIIVGE